MMRENKKGFTSLIIFFQFLFGSINCHTCEYHIPKINELINGISIEPLPSSFRQKRDASSNLKIYFDYQDSFTQSSQAESLKNSIMEPAKNQLQQLLIPKAPTNGILLVDRACVNSQYRMNNSSVKGCATGCTKTMCLNTEVPSKFLKQCVTIDSSGNVVYTETAGVGVPNYDIVLLVTYTSCNGGTLAYAASCFSESTLDRPILGVVNLCSDKIQSNTRIKENIKVVMHEIIHALGFAVDKYAFYRYENGTPIVPRNPFGWPDSGVSSQGSFYNWNSNIIKSVVRNRESVSMSYTVTFQGFVLPNVLAAARSHFNCPTLEAVDLENYGTIGDGSVMSHFDEYFLYNEMMTPQSNNGLDFLSNLTLALLQDTGWYTANFAAIRNLNYGYQKGCTIPEKGCYTYMKTHTDSLDPFCNQPFGYGRTIGCSPSKDYFYYCSLRRTSNVLPEYQYFTSLPGVASSDVQYYYGSSPYNEYCPSYMVQTDPSSICNDELNNNALNPYNIVPSYFGPDSMCFVNDMYYSYPNIIFGASCQKYTSVGSNKTTVSVANLNFLCPSNSNNNFTLDGRTFILRCPNDNRREILSYSSSNQDYSSLIVHKFLLICLLGVSLQMCI